MNNSSSRHREQPPISVQNWKQILDITERPCVLVTLEGQAVCANSVYERHSDRNVYSQLIADQIEIRHALTEAALSGMSQHVQLAHPQRLAMSAAPAGSSKYCIITILNELPADSSAAHTSVLHFGVLHGAIQKLEHSNAEGKSVFTLCESQILAHAQEILPALAKRGTVHTVIELAAAHSAPQQYLSESSLLGTNESGFVCICLTPVAADRCNRKLIDAIEHSASAFFIADRNGMILYTNRVLRSNDNSRKGVHALPNLQDMPVSALTADSGVSLWATLKSGLPWEGELAFPVNVKQQIWRLFSISPSGDSSANCCYIGIEHSANDMYAELQKIHQQHSFLESTLHALPLAFMVFNAPHYAQLHANNAAQGFCGKLACKVNQTFTKPFCAACHNSPGMYCLLEQCYQTKTAVTESLEIIENGETKPYAISLFPIFDNGAVRSIVALAEEHTAKVTGSSPHPQGEEQYLHEVSLQKTLLQSVINSIPDHIFYKDAAGIYLGSNSAFLSLAGVEAVEGKKDFDLFPKELAYYFSLQDQLVFKKGVPARSERWVQFPSGARVLLNTLRVPFKFQDKTVGVIGISSDITDIKRIEKELLEQKERIEAHNSEIAAQRDELQLQRDHVYRQNLEITQSINYALRIQNAVLPQREDIDKVLDDYFIYFKPRNIVSGDFYWFARKGNVSLIAAADCTGHGVPGALMSILGVAFLKQIVSGMDTYQTGDILNQLRKYIIMSLHQTGKDGETSDGLDIALYTIDHASMELHFSGAYNPLYLVRNDTLVEYKGDKMPISLHSIKSGFSTTKIQLQRNDAVYIFSDGYADQFGGIDGKKLKTNGFKSLIQSCSQMPMSDQQALFSSFFDEWKGSLDQVDDILVIGARF